MNALAQLSNLGPLSFIKRCFIKRSASAAVLLLALYLGAPPELAEGAEPKQAYGVSSESRAASREALKVLAEGGTATDAAVVAALVAGVTSPNSSGIGGGGFALSWDRVKQRASCLDFRETAPQLLDVEAFEKQPLPPSQVGHLVGVPGELKGLFELHQRAGRAPWAQLVGRAERHAREGFFVEQHLANMLQAASGKLANAPGFSAVFYPKGKPALVGMRIFHAALGQTLQRVGNEGPDALYRGSIAEDIVKTAREFGSQLSLDDLAHYKTKERTPLATSFEGATVYTMPAPSAGGLMMSEVLRLFSAEELRQLRHGTAAYQHLLAEAMRGAIADRMRYLGDPDFQKVDFSSLLAQKRLDIRRSKIELDRTHALPRFGLEEHGTHAIVTSDKDGNVVSLTTTVNRLFGAKIYAQASGIILNDELNDFTRKVDVEPFSMQQSPNRPRPSARPVSSMTPTIVVEDGRAKLALGGSGGMAIATNVLQVLLGAWVFDQSAEQAVSAPRIYIPTSKLSIMVEAHTKPELIASLKERGEVVGTLPAFATAVQLLKFKDNQVEAAADPRKHGLGQTAR